MAFRATLEELENADLLLHVIDASNPACGQQMASVHRILEDLNLDRIPVLNLLNKQDRVDADTMSRLAAETNGIAISATNARTLHPLIEKMEQILSGEQPEPAWQPQNAVAGTNPLLTDPTQPV